MADLFENMGFNTNPFSRFSAEEEKEYLQKIFVRPKYYATIHSDIKSGTSRFIFGERGVGKSALVLNLMNDFSEESVLSVLIDDYEGIKTTDNGSAILLLTIKKIETIFGLFLLKNKQCIKELDKNEKEKLTLFINTFFETLSKSQFEDLYNKTAHIKTLNIFKRIFNFFFLKPINIAFSGCSEFIGSTVSHALGLPPNVSENVYKEYFSELRESSYSEKIDPSALDYRTLKMMLFELTKIIKKCGFKGVVVIYDKIDEYRLLGTQISKIAAFAKDLALDTSLLLNGDVALVFSFWSRIKQSLIGLGVRCDKLKPVDITWTDNELESILGDRLAYFSTNRITSIDKIISDKYIETIFKLANCSPRHLIMLLSKIYDEQATINDEAKQFCDEAVEKGLANFVCTFDFGIYYAGEKLDTIQKAIKRLLRVSKVEFETKDLIDVFKISSQTANNWIRTMLSYGIVEDITIDTRAKQYHVVEPRITYMIENNLRYI